MHFIIIQKWGVTIYLMCCRKYHSNTFVKAQFFRVKSQRCVCSHSGQVVNEVTIYYIHTIVIQLRKMGQSKGVRMAPPLQHFILHSFFSVM